ncbi:hypothetical protein BG011_002488 [Mortierella polycephala]|uniref:DUF1279 domain-containing protein n=1 Tax=Mortierella polycephala TaxID=41804 RepID=A0A9P6QEW5_9FUNG|nr:hypothetical protein BG011_002488 [Mortierella polycephala]
MNPASFKPLAGNVSRHAVSISISAPASIRSSARSGMRFYNAHCTNTVRKTLYGAPHQSRFAGFPPSSSAASAASMTAHVTPYHPLASRFTSVVRRGFADNAAKSSSPSTSQQQVEKKSSGFMDKIKQLIKQYGYTGVAVYFGISMIDLAATFVVVKAAGMEKIEKAQDWAVDHVGKYFGRKKTPHNHSEDSKDDIDLDKLDDEQVGAIYNKASGLWSVFVIAYGIHKLLVPFRVVATGIVTPPLVKWLVKKGWIKEIAKGGSAAAAGSAVSKP